MLLVVIKCAIISCLVLVTGHLVADASNSMPRRLHCLAHVNLLNSRNGLDGGQFDRIQVEEFLDLDLQRTSVLIHNTRTGATSIYYNKLNSANDLAERVSILYEPARRACKPQRILNWPLAELRKVAIYLHGMRSLSNQRYEDTPLGPSVLLHALEENPSRFRFLGSVAGDAKTMTKKVDVFVGQMEYRVPGGNGRLEQVNVLVHVQGKRTRGEEMKKKRNQHQTLADAFFPSSSGKKFFIQETFRKLYASLRFVGVCRVSSGAEGDSATLNLNQLDEHNFCPEPGENLLFGVHYDLIQEHVPGTLIGRQLDQLSRDEYQFAREPYLQPVGMGCWDPEVNLGFQRSLLQEPPERRGGAGLVGVKLSAQLSSSNGPSGTTFVAYDGGAHLLRLDRNGHSSVYDLTQAKSYHLVHAPGRVSVEAQKCVVLDMEESTSLVGHRDHVLEQLVGLRPSGDDAHYLGTRVVDHQEYEVYEKELKLAAGGGGGGDSLPGVVELPILLQTNKYKSASSLDKRLFATYYTRQLRAADGLNHVGSIIFYFIELWEFEAKGGSKSLINRVKFTDFSWSLADGVEPTGGTAVTDSADLFDLAPCRQGRVAQARLKLVYAQQEGQHDSKQVATTTTTTTIEAGLRERTQELEEYLQRVLVESLEISRLNLVDLRAEAMAGVSGTTSLIVSGSIVELHSSSSLLKLLGSIHYDAAQVHYHAKRYLPNRHSLEECQLEHTEWHGRSPPTWFAYCPRLTLCIILLQSEQLAQLVTAPNNFEQDIDAVQQQVVEENDECLVYSFKYATLDKSGSNGLGWPGGGRGAIEQVQANEMRLHEKEIEFEYEYLDEEEDPRRRRRGRQVVKSAIYRAKLQSSDLEPLDPIGARLGNANLAALVGLRYTTAHEEPEACNLNHRPLASSSPPAPPDLARSHSDQVANTILIRQCQLACQLDEFCGSFSVCRKSGDCVLSPLRLTSERIDVLIATKRASKGNNFKLANVQKLPNNSSQTFIIKHEDGCSLHERDFVSEFQMIKSIELKPGARSARDFTSNGDNNRMSLDDCAGLSFERFLAEFEPTRKTSSHNFTYCPLESLCIVTTGLDEHNHYDNPTGEPVGQTMSFSCLVFARQTASVHYERKALTHLEVRPNRCEKTRIGENARTSRPVDYKSRVSLREFWASSEEDCARECNLNTIKCLSFDACREGNKTVCFLFSMRSPMAKRGAYLPLLKSEQELLTQHNLVLANNPMCNHFLLKRPFFEVKLRQLLAEQRQVDHAIQVPHPPPPGAVERELEKLENSIEQADDARSKQQLESLEREQEEANAALLNYELMKRSVDNQATSSLISWIHMLQLGVGLIIGSLGTIYKQQVANFVLNSYLTLR